MHVLNGMTITANKDEVLKTLRTNRDDHDKIVKEARVSYIDKARMAVSAKLDELAKDKAHTVRLHFTLEPPANYKKVYNVAIKMLEMHTGDTIELDNDQVQNLIMDKWDWQERFLGQTAGLSEFSVRKSRDLYGDDND